MFITEVVVSCCVLLDCNMLKCAFNIPPVFVNWVGKTLEAHLNIVQWVTFIVYLFIF